MQNIDFKGILFLLGGILLGSIPVYSSGVNGLKNNTAVLADSGYCDKKCAKIVVKECSELSYAEHTVQRKGNVICLSGDLNADAFADFYFAKISDGDVVVANSKVGDEKFGIKIAEILEGKKVTVVAWDACWSACAIHLFVPSKWKYAQNLNAVRFHGLFTDEMLESSKFEHVAKGYKLAYARATERLYSRLNLNPNIYKQATDNSVESYEGRYENQQSYAFKEYIQNGVTGFTFNPE